MISSICLGVPLFFKLCVLNHKRKNNKVYGEKIVMEDKLKWKKMTKNKTYLGNGGRDCSNATNAAASTCPENSNGSSRVKSCHTTTEKE